MFRKPLQIFRVYNKDMRNNFQNIAAHIHKISRKNDQRIEHTIG